MRPMDTNLHQAVSNINGEIEIYKSKPMNERNELNLLDRLNFVVNNDFKKKKIKCNTLNFMTARFCIKKKK